MRIVDLVLKLVQSIPIPVEHNLAKARMIKNLIWQLNLDATPGCYVEFGTAFGHSLRSAQLAIENTHYQEIGLGKQNRNCFSFDTFDGFQSNSPIDDHPVWTGRLFSADFNKVQHRFAKSPNVRIEKIDINELFRDGKRIPHENFGIKEKAALILFDVDLYQPTINALHWIAPKLQTGTFLMFDELNAFQGRSDKGEARAVIEFKQAYPNIVMKTISTYGAGGVVFQVEIN